MAIHVFVNPDVIMGSTFEMAFLDVLGEPALANVIYIVHPIGLSAQMVVVLMNSANFAKLFDLFGMLLWRTVLVIARTTDFGTLSMVVLCQNMGVTKEVMTVLLSNINMGRLFNIVLGDLVGGGFLYVGNFNFVLSIVELRYGNSGALPLPGGTVFGISVFKILIVSTSINTNFIVNVVMDELVCCQVVIGMCFLVVYPIGPAS